MLSTERGDNLAQTTPKQIAFELLLDDESKTRARIPLRILVHPQDVTDSIVATVKAFYGIYEGHGVSFEDVRGNSLVANYNNLVDGMTVNVRTVPGPVHPFLAAQQSHYQHVTSSDAQRRASLGDPFQMLPPHLHEVSRSPSRPSSRLARKRSTSPQVQRGRRSASHQKARSVSAASRGSSANGTYQEDNFNSYSDSEEGRSSVAGSRKARSEQYASAEISSENILQDGRRNKILFESSELPLFVPPQVPITTSTSSISPQRRSLGQEGQSQAYPFAQQLYGYQGYHTLSPHNHDPNGHALGSSAQYNTPLPAPPNPPHGHRLRDRSNIRSTAQTPGLRAGYAGHRVLPTPDPTVASCISDEDVARQLIALGDASNFSHGRTSASTLDDAFSGVADAASSTGATSDSGNESDKAGLINRAKRAFEDEDGEYELDGKIKDEYNDYDGQPRTKKVKTKAYDGSIHSYRSSKGSVKISKACANTMPKTSKSSAQHTLMKAPSAPEVQHRKASSSSMLDFQQSARGDEEDLSSKPRCQRCRKSKKGCDRQRPCQRCKDAGIGVEGCLSEDEGNGRKGRFGRHMGVPLAVKKDDGSMVDDDDSQAGAILTGMAIANADKNKKRKR